MEDLTAFARRTDLPVLAQAAILYAQVMSIRPFGKDDGRTGRAYLQGFLRERRLAENATLVLSAGLARQARHLPGALDAYRDGNLLRLLELFARAAGSAPDFGRWMNHRLEALHAEWEERLAGVRQGAAARRLLPRLLAEPLLSAGSGARAIDASTDAVQKAVRKLVEVGILSLMDPGKRRGRVWVAREVFALQRKALTAAWEMEPPGKPGVARGVGGLRA